MNFFEFKDSQLYAEDVKVTDLAKEFGHLYLGTEHILYGLVKNDIGIVANIFKEKSIIRRTKCSLFKKGGRFIFKK